MIFVIDQSPKLSAEQLSDVHLGQQVTNIARVISTAAYKQAPQEFTAVRIEGAPRLRYKDVEVLPPSNNATIQQWADWGRIAANRMWWLAQYAFFCDRELGDRFAVYQHPDYTRIDKWLKSGMLSALFPKADDKEKPVRIDDFPISFDVPSSALEQDAIEKYRAYYRALFAGAGNGFYPRMKWSSHKGQPVWMVSSPRQLPIVLQQPKHLCTACGSTAGGKLCDMDGCPMKDSCPF